MNNEIRIYVADFAAYSNNKLHGVWVSATDDLDDIWNQVNQLLAESLGGLVEEYAIHDYEGFGGYALGEYEGLETAQKIACLLVLLRNTRILVGVAE